MIVLEDYNPNWAIQADSEIKMLRKILNFPFVENIQHVGSTAIPTIKAKPVIDLMIGVYPFLEASKLIPLIESQGYHFWMDNPKKDRLFFVKGIPPFDEIRTHHVHVFEVGSYEWYAYPAFRDYLIQHPDEQHAYEILKLKCATHYQNDREAYTQAKAQFIQHIVQKTLCL